VAPSLEQWPCRFSSSLSSKGECLAQAAGAHCAGLASATPPGMRLIGRHLSMLFVGGPALRSVFRGMRILRRRDPTHLRDHVAELAFANVFRASVQQSSPNTQA
jgi:hypothetical protein